MTKTFDCALRLLARREHSLFELTNKLKQKGYDHHSIVDALTECQRCNYQSDERFTEQLGRMRMAQGHGPIRIHQELSSKGIASTLIEELLAQEDESSWIARAREVAFKKSPQLQELYSQQLGFRQGASERDKGVCTQYMTDGEKTCNAAENSSAQSISWDDQQKLKRFLLHRGFPVGIIVNLFDELIVR